MLLNKEIYWLQASRAEALFGLGQRDGATQAIQEAKEADPRPLDWMIESTEEQLRKLDKLLSFP